MVKRTITETVYEYDGDGKVTRKTVTETTEEDTNIYWPNTITTPFYQDPIYCTLQSSAGNTTERTMETSRM